MKTITVLVVHCYLLGRVSAGSSMNASETFGNCKDLKAGTLLAKFDDSKPPINEPCYNHAGLCGGGYPVCCVKYGTCMAIGGVTLSSNLAYYEGGCQSLNSSKTAWDTAENQDCKEQGECLAAYIQSNTGGFTNMRNGTALMADIPADHLTRIMVGSTWNGNTCPEVQSSQTTTGTSDGTSASGAGNVLPMLYSAIVCLFQFRP